MNVILVGYRGTGKSVVAQRLAQQLGLLRVCLDKEIERAAGKSIPEIVEEVDWPGFRDLEEQVVCKFAAQDGQVIDCGGGVIERAANIQRLRAAGTVFWLTASVPTIIARIQADDQRPSLTGDLSFTEEVQQVVQRRLPLYRRIAHHEVSNDGRTIAEVVDEICQLVSADGATGRKSPRS